MFPLFPLKNIKPIENVFFFILPFAVKINILIQKVKRLIENENENGLIENGLFFTIYSFINFGGNSGNKWEHPHNDALFSGNKTFDFWEQVGTQAVSTLFLYRNILTN